MSQRVEWTTNLTFEGDSEFDTGFRNCEKFNTTMEQVTEITTSDHRKLTHRDAEDQHPINAITSLEPELSIRPSATLTNQDIANILGA